MRILHADNGWHASVRVLSILVSWIVGKLQGHRPNEHGTLGNKFSEISPLKPAFDGISVVFSRLIYKALDWEEECCVLCIHAHMYEPHTYAVRRLCTSACTCIHAYMYTCICVDKYTYACVHVYVYACV